VIYYLCKDHLGSITGIMEPDGDILEEYSYDAWGIRRNPADWSYSNVSAPTYTQHGFTVHEHLDMFSLIHMLSEAKSREQSEAGNGRIYDPEIARFLSPDPVIQDLYSMLNYNRYTYCLNNPLIYIDPSGYKITSKTLDPPGASRFEVWLYNLWQDILYGGGDYGYSGAEDMETYNDYLDFSSGPFNSGDSQERIEGDYHTYGGSGGGPEKSKSTISKDDPILYFLSTYKQKLRAGDNGFIAPRDYDAVLGIAGFFDLISSVAQKDLPLVWGGATTGGVLTNSTALLNIYSDINESVNNSLGDRWRVGMNLFFLIADATAPFSAYLPSIADSYGLFEFLYHQADVNEKTGYWVYYNWYTKQWKKIKIKLKL